MFLALLVCISCQIIATCVWEWKISLFLNVKLKTCVSFLGLLKVEAETVSFFCWGTVEVLLYNTYSHTNTNNHIHKDILQEKLSLWAFHLDVSSKEETELNIFSNSSKWRTYHPLWNSFHLNEMWNATQKKRVPWLPNMLLMWMNFIHP